MNGFNLQTMVDGNICFICSRSTSLATWSMAQGLQQFFYDMCMCISRPPTACRLASIFHSMPFGTHFSRHADWHQLFTAGRLATSVIYFHFQHHAGTTLDQAYASHFPHIHRASEAMIRAHRRAEESTADAADAFDQPGAATSRLLAHHAEASGSKNCLHLF